MQRSPLPPQIPIGLKPYFQEHDIARLDISRDADLIIQRVLEFGTWDELRWLFETYGRKRIRLFLREHGERWLKPVTFLEITYDKDATFAAVWREVGISFFRLDSYPRIQPTF